MRKAIFWVAIILLITATFLGCSGLSLWSNAENGSGPKNTNSSTTREAVTILTGGTSGVYFPLGGALAEIYHRNLNVAVSFQSTGASAENCYKLARGKGELAFAMADTVSDAYYGQGRFEGKPLTNIRGLSAMYSNYLHLITTKDKGIASLADIRGKRVAVGAHGSGTEINAKRVLIAAGLTYDDIEEHFLSFAEAIQGLRDETIDVAVLSSGIPNIAVSKLAAEKQLVLIPVSHKIITKLQEVSPAYTDVIIPGATYPGVDTNIATVGVKNLIVTREELSEEFVYKLTKVIFENTDFLRSTHAAADNILLDTAVEGMPIPLHQGAERYYREMGVLEPQVSP
ncbi:TAXI family TRAP transporter solute-binding subunit [Metallumcola ferriviriculae]|uniref:TAXI family TRAP transporter solute-binding subunit n=1 Tax=Metallumcola ferriviriculae TaxID=3039180 RepID=A0AAU0URC5_9FIRM|nr:TAXI family TRAP transporter solute-binding subunit [Desulfitibacteraceae bacterium MK1]